jgi:hypothetical protein
MTAVVATRDALMLRSKAIASPGSAIIRKPAQKQL